MTQKFQENLTKEENTKFLLRNKSPEAELNLKQCWILSEKYEVIGSWRKWYGLALNLCATLTLKIFLEKLGRNILESRETVLKSSEP